MPAVPTSIDDTLKLLASAGYIADRALATVLYLSLKMGRPLFLEGEAGVGKTEIAKVLATTLGRAIAGDTGTLFLPRRRDGARKAWLGGRQRMKGALVVDAGCAKALLKGGSLLASGIVSLEGEFVRGDPIGVRDDRGKPIAQGLAEYDAAEIGRIKGTRTEEHQALLGYAPRSAVIHRDQLVLL